MTTIDTTETILARWSRMRRKLATRDKVRALHGAALAWERRSEALAMAGMFREADDATSEAMALGALADEIKTDTPTAG